MEISGPPSIRWNENEKKKREKKGNTYNRQNFKNHEIPNREKKKRLVFVIENSAFLTLDRVNQILRFTGSLYAIHAGLKRPLILPCRILLKNYSNKFNPSIFPAPPRGTAPKYRAARNP